MKYLGANLCFLSLITSYLFASASVNPSLSIYQNKSAQIEIAQHPLAIRAIDVLLQPQQNLRQLNEENFSDIWEARRLAETYLARAGYQNRLCYSKFEADASPAWQVAAFPILQGYLDNWVIRKIYSIWQQARVLLRTIFPAHNQSEEVLEKERTFWNALETTLPSQEGRKNGRGALAKEEVIHKQIIFPNTLSSEGSEILLLYNYAPLRTGGEQMHFLLIPHPSKPAENFLELDKEQYIQVLSLAKKVALWADDVFEGQTIVHFFDKTGEMAGQTQPLFHAHLVIVKRGSEEMWGKVAMFFRMIFPSKPLPFNELERRVNRYRNSLGQFLTQHI